MPNFGLVIDSTYNPMSFEQYSAPFEKYAKVYNEMADAFDTLEMEANKWEKLASSSQDQAQYEQYKKYARDLRAAANDLAENGLSTKTRGLVSSLRGRYASEIQPIEDAYNYRAKLAEEQRKLNPKGDLQWDIDFSKIGLGAIMNNPTLSYSPGRSLSEMEQAGEDIGKAASTRRVLSEKARDMGNQYYRVMKGYDGGDVQAFLDKNANDPAFQELMQLYDQVRTSYGTNNTQSIYSAEQNSIADERILTGMLKGLAYNEDYQINYDAKSTKTSKKTGSDSDDEVTYDPIGYSIVYTDSQGNEQELTKVNAQGKEVYYNDKGVKYTITGKQKNKDGTVNYTLVDSNNNSLSFKQTKDQAAIPETRFAVVSAGNKSDGWVVDLRNNNEKVVDENGRLMTFDRNTHYWDSVNRKVKLIPATSTNSKVYVTKGGAPVIVSNSKGVSVETDWDDFIKDDIDNLLKDKSKELTYEQLTEDEKNKLPDNVKAAPNAYLYYRATIDAVGGPSKGDNHMLFSKYVGTVKANPTVEEGDVKDAFE